MSNEHSEMKLTISFTIASKNKIPRYNFKKRSKDLYTETYKTLLKDIKEDLNKWNDTHVHGSKDVKLLRW